MSTLHPTSRPVVLRPAGPADASALATLAALDSRDVPPAPHVLVEVDGVVRAAVSVVDGSAVADPFHPTARLVDLARTHALAA